MNKYITLPILTLISIFTNACLAEESESESALAATSLPEGFKTAVLGAGCFWCVEVFYEGLEGVHEVVSGYAGGDESNPSYKQVASGNTTHAEVVQVIYDPDSISYRALIDFFWTTHDASRDDGVWPDFGPHYRSILLYTNEFEKSTIEASRKAYEKARDIRIATEIKALDQFYPAESYHQDYARKNPNDRYVRGILRPKLKKLGMEIDKKYRPSTLDEVVQ